MEDYKYIAVEGNIGAGKTSLCKLLAKRYNADLLLEEFEENSFLKGFYQDKARYAFSLELSFLADRFHQVSKSINENIVIADYHIAKTIAFASHTLNPDEFELFRKLYDIMIEQLPKVDLLIYLQRDTDTLLKNIKLRGREYEKSIDTTYLEAVENSYQELLPELNVPRVLHLDCSDLDFVNDAAHFRKLMMVIESGEHQAYSRHKIC